MRQDGACELCGFNSFYCIESVTVMRAVLVRLCYDCANGLETRLGKSFIDLWSELKYREAELDFLKQVGPRDSIELISNCVVANKDLLRFKLVEWFEANYKRVEAKP